MALAYLLDPAVKRLERARINRMLATLLVITLFVGFLPAHHHLIVPIFGAQLCAFIEQLPRTIARLQALVTDPSRTWLRRVVGEGFRDADIGELVRQGSGYMATFLRSLWSGGQALISIFSLLVVTPVVAFYLLHDWDRMVRYRRLLGAGSAPRNRAGARARDQRPRSPGFVRGQTAVCLILGSFYAVGLSLVGLNFGLLIGLISGIITFIPYVGSMTGLVLALGIAVAQFWPAWGPILVVAGIFFVGQFLEGLCAGAEAGRRERRACTRCG